MADASGAFQQLAFQHAGKRHTYDFDDDATLLDLSNYVAEELGIPQSNQKFLVAPKPGMLKPPFDDPSKPALLLSEISSRKITLLGSTPAQVDSLNKAIADAKPRPAPKTTAKAYTTRKPNTNGYTFSEIRPLPQFKDPERSTRFLERLRDDPGIRFTMNKHKWTVPLLTEMDPSENTSGSHEGVTRILGLNRNQGQIIELRLRTDAYDGYRDYKTIRDTLCHELAHNVHGDHDRQFWDLCHQIEREVNSADWTRGGHSLGKQEYYDPGPAEEAADHGAWSGGSYRLGSAISSAGSRTTSTPSDSAASRREAMARAAEERARRSREGDGNS